MTPQERAASARKAVMTRWARTKKTGYRKGVAESSTSQLMDSRDTKSERRRYKVVLADCFDWLAGASKESIHAVVTDPPYGLLEFSEVEKTKLRAGRGGVWRIPPAFDGSQRRPLPRFTVLNETDHGALSAFFKRWGEFLYPVLVPGAHVFVATNPLLSDFLCSGLRGAGLEKRGELIRLVQTLRGGDRPKNAHREFADVTVMPRSGHEPWVVFRKPCMGRVQDNLRTYGTGALRRVSDDQPFRDVIPSSPTRSSERELANHPALKPQAFMRQIVRAALPLGKGVVLDPFMGAGSTLAAAEYLGYESLGIEKDPQYFDMAVQAIPLLAQFGAMDRRQAMLLPSNLSYSL
jgi:site-specific DNA-methyltransferase (adenine-specific)